MRRNINRKPDPDKKNGSPDPGKKKYNRPDYSETTNIRTASEKRIADNENDDEPSGEFRRSVTNTDEQDKITNIESDPLNEKEKEGV
jgi:hypothetical protein